MSAPRAIGRRQVLTGAGVAAGAAIAGVGFAPPADAHADRDQGLSGSWLIVRQDDGSPDKVSGVLSFAAGSVIIEQDINPVGPVFTGTWSASDGDGEGDGDRFRATFWAGFPGQGPDQPATTVQVKLRGRRHRKSISGSYRFTVFDPTSNTVVQTGTGSFTGSPINA